MLRLPAISPEKTATTGLLLPRRSRKNLGPQLQSLRQSLETVAVSLCGDIVAEGIGFRFFSFHSQNALLLLNSKFEMSVPLGSPFVTNTKMFSIYNISINVTLILNTVNEQLLHEAFRYIHGHQVADQLSFY